ncbi:MAG: S9 family peptidase [Candidatus Oleimicrobiaceae bacterium]
MLSLNRRTPVRMLFIGLLLFAGSGWAQKKLLTYKQAYEGGEPRLLGQLPRVEGWLDDTHYLERSSQGEGQETKLRLMKVDAATGEATVFLDYEQLNAKLPSGFFLQAAVDHTADYTGFLLHHRDDLYCFCATDGLFKRLTATPGEEKNARFSPDGTKVAYTRDNNLFVLDIRSGLEHQLTNDGSDTVYNGWASWVYYEEILGRASRYAAFWWAPNSQMVAFLRFDDGPVPTFPLFRADGVHGELEITRYPKAGDPNPYVKLGIAHVDEGKIVWVDMDEKADHYIAWPFWTQDSKQLLFQWMNRGQDHLKLLAADPSTGKVHQVYEERQPAWVEFFQDLYFFRDGSGFLLRSSVDGWYHLYLYDMEGKLKRRLTAGEFTVSSISLVDETHRVVYFLGAPKGLPESHLYRVGLDGKGLQRLTSAPGAHRCTVSPQGSFFLDTYSSIEHPSRMELRTTDGALVRTLGDTKLDLLDEYALGRVELFTIPAGDGFDLPAVWVLPPDFDPAKRYPVLFEVYGGPASPTVSNSFRRLSWHYLAQRGIIVISVDHRGSGHFGKKGVDLMHRNLGKWEMNDLIAAVKWLRKKPFVDSTRVGITGGSYGGYTTCMALTYGADYFTHGVAEFSVTDWRLYDTVYTERYMDTPTENPEGYRFGSVLTHADKYKGRLLITHGTMDDNVHMQNTIQFIDRLEELNKDFQLLLYPNARHGIGGRKGSHARRQGVAFWLAHFLGQQLDPDK